MKSLKPALLTSLRLVRHSSLCITGLSSLLFPNLSTGSLILNEAQKPVGSALVAQEFEIAALFLAAAQCGELRPRFPAAREAKEGPTSAALKQTIAERAAALRTAHALSADAAVPEELLQASGSGIDPHISPEAAEFQLDRVCRERGFDGRQRADVAKLIAELTEPPFARTLGAWRINVLLLNVRLDAVK